MTDTAHPAPPSPPPPSPARPRASAVRIVVQLVGYAAGIALLVWCASRALSAENRGQLARLAEASVADVAFLCALSVASILLNGLIFWTAVRPARRVPLGSVLATNAIATALNYVPFKLSMISRILIHNRRDHVPLLTILAWLATVVLILGITLGPLIALALARPRIDAAWIGLAVLSIACVAGIIITTARVCLRPRAQRLGVALLSRFPLLARLLTEPRRASITDGLRMLGRPGAVGAGILLRLADVSVQSARFVVAAGILGATLSFDRAFLLAATYFGIGIISPFGMLGTREAGAAGLADALDIPSPDTIAAVVLLVSATEALVTVILATIGAIYLRPMRLMVREVARIAAEEAGPTAAPPPPLPSDDATGAGTTQPDGR